MKNYIIIYHSKKYSNIHCPVDWEGSYCKAKEKAVDRLLESQKDNVYSSATIWQVSKHRISKRCKVELSKYLLVNQVSTASEKKKKFDPPELALFEENEEFTEEITESITREIWSVRYGGLGRKA